MSFSSLSNAEKIAATRIAIQRVESSIYRAVSELGIDPDTFDMNTFEIGDEMIGDAPNPDFGSRKQIAAEIARLDILNQKLQQLS